MHDQNVVNLSALIEFHNTSGMAERPRGLKNFCRKNCAANCASIKIKSHIGEAMKNTNDLFSFHKNNDSVNCQSINPNLPRWDVFTPDSDPFL